MGKTGIPLSREKLRDLRSLESAKIRRRKGLCLVEGERSLGEADSTGNLLYLVISDESAAQHGSFVKNLTKSGLPCYSLLPSLFKEVSSVRSSTGVMGVARIPDPAEPCALEDVSGRSLLLYLDGIQEPGNVGALFRTAWALGFAGVLLGEGTADPFSAKAVRASAGAVFNLPYYEAIGPRETRDLVSAGYSVFVGRRGGQDFSTIEYPERSILALGNEGAGPSGWILQAGSAVGIPMAEGVDSLNVVVAGGIIAAAMRR